MGRIRRYLKADNSAHGNTHKRLCVRLYEPLNLGLKVYVYGRKKPIERALMRSAAMFEMEANTMENFVERVELDYMPYDHMFSGELCHATGFEVLDANGDWWYEYENSDGDLFYGR